MAKFNTGQQGKIFKLLRGTLCHDRDAFRFGEIFHATIDYQSFCREPKVVSTKAIDDLEKYMSEWCEKKREQIRKVR